MQSYTIREARAGDCSNIMKLIEELAEFEKMPDQVKISADVLRRDGFGDEPLFHCIVAETNSCADGETKDLRVVGYCLYYYTYSTWEGRAVFMEDLYVTPDHRGRGVGTKMWRRLTQIALDKRCVRLQLSVLDWNTNALDAYKKNGARDLTEKEGWHFMRMDEQAMKAFAKSE